MRRGLATLLLFSPCGLAVCGVAACTSFGESEAPSDGGLADVRAADAGEAGTEAAPAPAVFADDFERNELLGAWSRTSAMNGGNAIVLDGAQHASGTRSLHATVSGQAGIAFLERNGQLQNLQRVELSIRYDTLPKVGVILAKVVYDNDTEINLTLAGSGLKASEQKSTDSTHFSESPGTLVPAAEWIRLVWTMDYATKSVTIEAPGRMPAIKVIYKLAKTDFGASVTALRAGVVYAPAQGTGATNVWLDDLAFY